MNETIATVIDRTNGTGGYLGVDTDTGAKFYRATEIDAWVPATGLTDAEVEIADFYFQELRVLA